MTLIQRFLRRPKKTPPRGTDHDLVAAARRRLEDDQERRRQVEADLKILSRESDR